MFGHERFKQNREWGILVGSSSTTSNRFLHARPNIKDRWRSLSSKSRSCITIVHGTCSSIKPFFCIHKSSYTVTLIHSLLASLYRSNQQAHRPSETIGICHRSCCCSSRMLPIWVRFSVPWSFVIPASATASSLSVSSFFFSMRICHAYHLSIWSYQRNCSTCYHVGSTRDLHQRSLLFYRNRVVPCLVILTAHVITFHQEFSQESPLSAIDRIKLCIIYCGL